MERPFRTLATSFGELVPAVSPDGRWIAYASNEAGDFAIYVQPFPEGGARYEVSVDGAWGPVWSPDGTELFYLRGPDRPELVAGGVRTGEGFEVGEPTALFEAPGECYDVHPDGRSFAMVRGGDVTPDRIVVTVNALGR